MKRPKEIEWLFQQLPEWVESDLISPVQAEALRERYAGEPHGPDLPIAGLIAGILGGLLIGGGIILIVAYNWDDLSHTWRTLISFAPLLAGQFLYGYAFFRQRSSGGWTEGSATFLMLALAACLALVSQTYHIAGRPEEFLWTWLWLSLPLLYLRPASVPAVLFLVGTCAWAMQAPSASRHWSYLLLLAAIPHLYWGMRPAAEAVRRQVLGWASGLTVFAIWLAVTPGKLPEYSLLGSALIASVLYLAGNPLFQANRPAWRRPWPILGRIAAFILLLVTTYDLNLPAFNSAELLYGTPRFSERAGMIHFGVLLLLGISYLILLSRRWRSLSGPDWFPSLLPVFFLSYLTSYRVLGNLPAMILANGFLLAWGALHLYRGVREREMSSVNLGMFLILVLATARFFDTDWSALGKGIAFVLLGIAFLAARYTLGKMLENKGP